MQTLGRRRACRVSSVGAALFIGWAAHAADSRYIVVLEGKSLAAAARSTGRAAAPATATADRREQILREQDAASVWIEARGGHVLERYQLLNHALFVEIPADQVAALRALPGVASVHAERHYQRQLTRSVPFIGAGKVWAGVSGANGMTGKGVRIGIIDSGIDYTHAMFGGKGTVAAYNANNSAVIEAGSFPTSKVVGGTDFVGDDYDSSGISGSPTPVPDRDPLDHADNGHGSHVAGIAAGFGVLTNGATFHGPYTATLDPKSFGIGPGVAPEASLYALKVFGASGTTSSSIVVKALNWAADPNGDGNTSDHLDVVNLSLGSGFSDDAPDDPEREAVDALVQAGCVVAISAGNGGDAAYNVGSPSSAPRAISVADSIPPGFVSGAIKVNLPSSVAGSYTSVEADFSKPLAGSPAVRARVLMASPALACDPLANSSGMAGKIAMIDRGDCNFDDKVLNAEEAGAVAVIVVNNVGGTPVVMGAGSGHTVHIPAVMISKDDGAKLKKELLHGLDVTMSGDTVVAHPEFTDNLHVSSSRGPVYAEAVLKPDIAAPGDQIKSTLAGSGTSGIAYTGTSMSSPHLAGAAALVRQARPDWSAEDVKAVLMNTAVTPMRDASGNPYSESRAGAGRVAVDRAVSSPVSIRAEDDGGGVSLSFGQILAGAPVTRTGTYVVSNHGTVPVTLTLVSSNTLANPGVVLVPKVPSVTVGPHATARVEVELRVTPGLLNANPDKTSDAPIDGSPHYGLPEGTGELWFFGGPVDVHVPWYSVVRATSSMTSPTRIAGTPPGNLVTVPIPTRGTNAHARPVVGVFQFGASSVVKHFNDARDITDLVVVGAASDFAKAGSVAQTRLYFALATGAPWATPQRVFDALDIEIDLDGDGVPDLALLNSNQGSTAANDTEDSGDANDAFITTVDHLDGLAYEIGGVGNGISPAVLDTAPYENAVWVHTATAAQLGLTAAKSSFRYRATTQGVFGESSAWVKFDAAKPVVDGTAFGVLNTPWQDEGSKVKANISRPNATAAGILSNGQVSVLLVHAQGTPGAQTETVKFNLGTEDIDGDGLPDAWEMANLGDLASTGTADRDGDGLTDAQEFAAGTDPSDAQSRLALLPPSHPGDAVTWVSVVGKKYSVLRADVVLGPYVAVKTGIEATDTTSAFGDPDLAGATHPYFYRVQLDP